MEICKRSVILFLVLLLMTIVVIGQTKVKGSGYILTQQREVADFASIEVAGGVDVAIVKGEREPIIVEADDNLFPYIRTIVKDKILKIYISDTVDIVKYAAMNVLVSMPDLCDLTACQSSKIDAWPHVWSLSHIQLQASTGGEIRIRMEAIDIQVDARTLGFIKLKGKTENLKASIKTAADLDARELEAENASLYLSIGAKAEIQVKKLLTYRLFGHSRLIYQGEPEIVNSTLHTGSKVMKEK